MSCLTEAIQTYGSQRPVPSSIAGAEGIGRVARASYLACCAPRDPDAQQVLFRMRSQGDTLAAVLRELVRIKGRLPGLPGVGRLHYYTLRDTSNASAYGGPRDVRGRRPQAYDSGLIGSGGARDSEGHCLPEGDGCREQDSRTWYDSRTDVVAKVDRAKGFTRSLQPRLACACFETAYCVGDGRRAARDRHWREA